MHDPGVALVTGAGGGIGAAVCRAFAAEGRSVALLDTAVEPLEQLAAYLEEKGAAVSVHHVDVSRPHSVEAGVAAAEWRLGPVDILVNCAGVFPIGNVLDVDDQDWARSFAVNADGVFHVSRAVGRRMRTRARGAIVTVASNAAGVTRMGMGAYAPAKAAAMMLTRCLGLELAASGVWCNVVCPGSTDTAMLRALIGGDDPAAVVAGVPEQYRVGIPLGRVADVTDVAEAVLFLSSPKARHITMQALYVDGGASLRG